MKKMLIWILFAVLSLSVFLSVFKAPILNYGGDIAEYHGITETIIKSGRISLTPIAEYNLRRFLQPSYFDNAGYYVDGKDGLRYPVHFVLYSILAVPTRLALHALSINELQTLRITNVIIFIAVLAFSLKYLAKNQFTKLILILAVFLSPILFFLSWPGPDIFYLSLLLISVQLFFKKRYISSGILASLAATQSQPLMILTILISMYGVFDYFSKARNLKESLSTHVRFLLKIGLIGIILLIPIFYNIHFFGHWSPWTHLQDGWTLIRGFGFHNMSLQKLYEQFFDLNFGLIFYAPVLILCGFFFLIKNLRQKSTLLLFLMFLATAFFYQTNPAWHYGTAGYGPSRHAIFFLPFFIVLFINNIKQSFRYYLLLGILIVTQIPILIMNGIVSPNLQNSLQQSPAAKFLLNNWPGLYNPTPEIFVDRTNHTDIDYPTSAIYKFRGICKKAYILKTDTGLLEKECGNIPEQYKNMLDDDLSRKSNISRTTKTTEATFWPDPQSCSAEYIGPYTCMNTREDFEKKTGFANSTRIGDLGNGVWRLNTGKPVKIHIPAGYFIQYHSFEGIYINY